MTWRYIASALIVLTSVAYSGVAAAQFRGSVQAQAMIESLDLKEAKVLDAVRIISELTNVNIFATREAGVRDVSLFVRNMTVHNAIDSLARVSGLWYRYSRESDAYLVMTAEEFQGDLIIFREDFHRVFTLRYQNVSTTAQVIEALFGDRVELTLETDDDEDVLESEARDTFAAGGARSNDRVTRNQGRSRSNRRFSRDSRRSFTDRSGRAGGDRTAIDDDPLVDEELSTQQLSSLTADQDGELPVVGEQAVTRITRREPRIFVTVNRLHNLLYVRTSDERALEQIEEIVLASDRPAPQVLLEMKILSLDIGDGFRSLFNFDFRSRSTTTATDAEGNQVTVPELALSTGNFVLQGGAFAFQFINDVINARLELVENDNRVNVLATPLILASNTRPAQIFIGEERVITTGFETNTQTSALGGVAFNVIETETEIRDIGTTLRIVPTINSDRTVSMRIEQDTSTVNEEAQVIPVVNDNGQVTQVAVDSVNTANIVGTILAKDGLTVAIGGLIQRESRNTQSKVPLLGDVPVLGALFRREVTEDIETELVLLITPHVFTTPQEAEEISRQRAISLSNNPESERYGFAASKNQPEVATGGDVGTFVALTRYAALSLAGRAPAADGIVSVPLLDRPVTSLMTSNALRFEVKRAWRRDRLYVTAVEVRNASDGAVALDPKSVFGNWLAVSTEVDELQASGESGDRAMMFLISDRPFEDARPGAVSLSGASSNARTAS